MIHLCCLCRFSLWNQRQADGLTVCSPEGSWVIAGRDRPGRSSKDMYLQLVAEAQTFLFLFDSGRAFLTDLLR